MPGEPHEGAPAPTGEPPRRSRFDEADPKRVGLIGGIGLGVVLLLIFIVQNSQTVGVSFIFFEIRLSLIWVIVLSGIAGWGVGTLTSRLVRRRMADRRRA